MGVEFSSINLHYLMAAKNVAEMDPKVAATIMGLPIELAKKFATLDAARLSGLAKVEIPLLVARGDALWWSRLFDALDSQHDDEIETVLEHGRLMYLSE